MSSSSVNKPLQYGDVVSFFTNDDPERAGFLSTLG
jgi:hypothetical protein